MKYPIYRTGIGQDSHRFEKESTQKKCIIGGVVIEGIHGFDADSDGDIILHSICNAITSLTHVPILGKVAVELYAKQNIRDSRVYLVEALKTLDKQQIVHCALTIEGKKPRLQEHVDTIRKSVAKLLSISVDQVGLTITSGDELTDFAKGRGAQCFCILTTMFENK